MQQEILQEFRNTEYKPLYFTSVAVTKWQALASIIQKVAIMAISALYWE